MQWTKLTLVLFTTLTACASRPSKGFNPPVSATHDDTRPPPSDKAFISDAKSPGGPDQTGLATYYSDKLAGHKTYNGELYDPKLLTAAHRKLPINTWVEVRRVDTGTTVRVRVNDRGPWGDDRRIIDLSREAARRLGMLGEGVVHVEIRVVSGPE